jgi:hypothetical protein
MAILAPNGQDPNNPNNNQPNQGGGGTVMNSAAGGGNAPGVSGGGGGATGGASNTQARPAGNPSGTPNVNDYLNANQGAGQKLASGITTNVQNQANQVNNQVNTSQNQLNSQYNPLNQTLGQGQSAANTAFQDPSALLSAYQNAQASSAGGSAYQGPQANNTDLANYNAFQGDVAGTNQYNQQQQQLQNYNNTGQQANNTAQTQLNSLGQTTGSAANEMGRNQLLQNTVGNSNYNQGQQTLDSLFLQGQGNQLQQNLGNIQNQTAANVNNANTDYQTKLNNLQGLSGSNTQYAKNLFLNGPGTTANAPQGQGLNQIGTAATAAAAADNASAPAQLAALQAAAAANNGQGRFTAAQLQQLGLQPGEQAWGVGLGGGTGDANFIQAGTPATAATATDQATLDRYNALNQLAGGPNGLQTSVFGNATTAGGYNPINFNNAGFQTAVQNQQNAILGSDFSNAISGISGTDNSSFANLIQNLQTQQAAGKLTPQQAMQEANAVKQSYVNSTNAMGQGQLTPAATVADQRLQSLTNYYNNVYNPAAGDTLGNTLTTIGGQTVVGGNPNQPTNGGFGRGATF